MKKLISRESLSGQGLFRKAGVLGMCFCLFHALGATVWAQVPTKIWDKTLGSANLDQLIAMTPAAGGGYIVAARSGLGISGDKTQAGQGSTDFWILKVDDAGNKVWDKTFGGAGGDIVAAITPVAGGGYIIVGSSSSGISGEKTQASQGSDDYWVVKIDEDGFKVWDRTFGGSGIDIPQSIIPAVGGGYIIAGASTSGISGDKTQAGLGSYDFWVVKIDEAGNKVWDRTIGGSGNDQATTITPATGGGYVIGGISASGISGDRTQTHQGGWDYWVVKIDEAGTKVWDSRFGGSNNDEAKAITPATGGGYIVAGQSASGISGDKTQASQGGNDYWVVKIDEAGAKVWDKRFGGTGAESAYSVVVATGGGYLLSGSSVSDISGDKTQASQGASDYWLVKIDEAGNKVWDGRFGGSGGEGGGSIVPAAGGGYIVGGQSNSPISGDKSQASQGSADLWLVKFVEPNNAPTNLALSPASIAENNAVNAVVGTFTTTDPDAGDSHTYSLVSGAGDADNASFTIVGNELRANISFDFETKSSYSIRVRTTDQGNLAYEQVFTIAITDVPEGGGPAVISLVPVSLPVSANEGSDFSEYLVNVVLSGATTYPVSVQFNTSGTAIRAQAAGPNASCGSKTVRDYSIAPSTASGPVTLTWLSALTSVAKQLRIRINGDDCPEPDEDFTITLLNPVNATLGTSSFTHTILNDDAPRLGEDSGLEALTTGLTLYPNPTQGALTLQFQANVEGVESLQVLDVAGRVVHTQPVNAVEGRNEVALDLSAQPAGVYFVQALGQTAKVVLAK